jgi:hypothetical protein
MSKGADIQGYILNKLSEAHSICEKVLRTDIIEEKGVIVLLFYLGVGTNPKYSTFQETLSLMASYIPYTT